MNAEYVVLGSVCWWLMKKKVYLWYNHTYGTIYARIAGIISHKVFHTSPFAFTASFKNALKMPAGIDTETFRRNENIRKMKNSILYVGRISPVKNVNILLEAAKILNKRGIEFTLDIYGSAPKRDKKYYESLLKSVEEMSLKKVVSFYDSIPNYKATEVYNTHEISVNLTPKGNFDKTVLEGMACETLALVSSEAFKGILSKEFLFEENNPNNLTDKLKVIFNMSHEQKILYAKEMRGEVIKKHNLISLTEKLIQLIK